MIKLTQITTLSLLSLIGLLFAGCATQDESRPNILFIMSDDHTSQAISAYGGILETVNPTPNIDRLAVEGMLLSNCFVTNSIDFAPTILDAAGLTAPEEMQGVSFLPVVLGEKVNGWRESMYYRYYYSHFKTEPHYGIRTHDYKLIYYNRTGEWELYDLETDPYEMNNVFDHSGYIEISDSLRRELTRMQKEVSDDPRDMGNHPNIGALAADQKMKSEICTI